MCVNETTFGGVLFVNEYKVQLAETGKYTASTLSLENNIKCYFQQITPPENNKILTQ